MFKAIANSKNVLTFAVSLIAYCCFYNTTYSQSVVTQAGVTRVVVDAGHGGLDPGAIGKTSQEKDLNLAVALLVGKLIKEEFPSVEVIYTRTTDVFIDVDKRSKLANDRKADLFISIHANASENKAATGTETYVMGHGKSDANMEVAKRENAVITYEENYTSKYEGYDPKDPGSFILFSLQQNAFLTQSQELATKVQEEFGSHPIKNNRGMKEGLFLVLWHTAMPSILVEMGYISNVRDERILVSKQGQRAIAQAIFRAFKSYKTHYDRHGELAKNTEIQGRRDVASAKTVEKQKKAAGQKQQGKSPKLSYRVQIKASTAKLPVTSAEFAEFKEVSYILNKNIYKYMTGNFATFEEAVKYCNEVVRKKTKDAFVICIEDGKIVPLKK